MLLNQSEIRAGWERALLPSPKYRIVENTRPDDAGEIQRKPNKKTDTRVARSGAAPVIRKSRERFAQPPDLLR
jgi:hypothetical protein